MQLSDVVAEYRHCAFCGLGIRHDRAYRPDDASPWYHSEECYRFSLTYPDLVARLRAEGPARPDAHQDGPAHQDEPGR